MTEYLTFIILLNAYYSIVFAPDLVLFISFDRMTEYSIIIMLLLNEHYCGKGVVAALGGDQDGGSGDAREPPPRRSRRAVPRDRPRPVRVHIIFSPLSL